MSYEENRTYTNSDTAKPVVQIPPEYAPLSPWAYFGYSLLFSIPFVGFILLIVFALVSGNINRRNYARSYFCSLALVLILFAIILVLGLGTGLLAGIASELNL